MRPPSTAALVQPVRNPYLYDAERRSSPRHVCSLEATLHSMEGGDALSWGAVVYDISSRGVGMTLCFPFRPGTYLAVELHTPSGMARTLMVRVQNVHDQPDGTWRVGCEFVKPMNESDMELLV